MLLAVKTSVSVLPIHLMTPVKHHCKKTLLFLPLMDDDSLSDGLLLVGLGIMPVKMDVQKL